MAINNAWKTGWCCVLLFLAQTVAAKDYIITDFGAKPGPAALNTIAINKAITACHAAGGGRVVVPAGTFLSGTLLMKDNVELYLEMGATLLASTALKDFPVQPLPACRSQKDAGGWRALIYANEVTNIAITGGGTIDGNGASQKPDPDSKFKGDLDGRPRNILFISCRNIRIEQVHLRNAGIWNQHYLNCEDVLVDRIQVFNHANRNNDGIDIDGCRRFTLSNSIFDTDDDAIVLKSTGPAPDEDIVITNCIVSSFCNAIKAGTESTGGFKNITVSNCVIKPSRDTHPPIYGAAGGIAGISLEIVDGGVMTGVSISNITIEGTACPLYVRLGNRARKYMPEAPTPPVGEMKNIVINNIVAYHTGNYCSSVTAIPGHYIENIFLSDIQFHHAGGLQAGDYIDTPEKVKEEEDSYPQPTVWKELPSSGLFIRHVKNIQVSNLLVDAEKADPRIPVIAVDVAGLQIRNTAKISNSTGPVFFSGKAVRDLIVESPLEWKKEIMVKAE